MTTTSEARMTANRQNAQKSTGPKTPEGKANSRRNGLKHGLTGAGIVLIEEDASEVNLRASALLAELEPKSIIGEILVGQIATLSVRMERGAKQEEEALASRVRHATEVFDQDRIDAAEYLFKTIAEDPRANLIDLRRMPEGVDRLLEGWGYLRDVLFRSVEFPGYYWEPAHQAMVAHLSGFSLDQVKGSRLDMLSLAVRNHFPRIDDPEWNALESNQKRAWARDRLVEHIDLEIAGLKAHRATLNLEAIKLDRQGAPKLALFDSSREATLARRYESEARRGFFKALKEFERAEAEVKAEVEAADQPASLPIPDPTPARVSEPLASSCAGSSPILRDPKPAARSGLDRSVERDFEARRGLNGRVVTIGKAVVVPG